MGKGKGYPTDPKAGQTATCFRGGSDQHMVGDCLVPKGNGKGKGRTWVKPRGMGFISELAYEEFMTSSGHYVTTTNRDSYMSLMAITDEQCTTYKST